MFKGYVEVGAPPLDKWLSVSQNMDFGLMAAEINILPPIKPDTFVFGLRTINDLVNMFEYRSDTKDYWKNPNDFFQDQFGDCEDFAIAKYALLRIMGVQDSQIKLLIVRDTSRQIDHAILTVYDSYNDNPWVLDIYRENDMNQADMYQDIYEPIISINNTSTSRYFLAKDLP
jgi:hypothetical protein